MRLSLLIWKPADANSSWVQGRRYKGRCASGRWGRPVQQERNAVERADARVGLVPDAPEDGWRG
eukprot:COSAG04_NODE_6998_length_1213_cov_0.759425_1_plen_63_part_10